METPETTNDRTTKYITAVRAQMAQNGHTTNGELHEALRVIYPDLSATTVHRITTRMLQRGELQLAPAGRANTLRYDANITAHDHFMCNTCGILRDAHLDGIIRSEIEKTIGDGCSISGSLTVSGICKKCQRREQ